MTSMLSVPVFLAEHGISRSLFYRLVNEGRGPRLTKIGGRTLITAEAATEWRARMERETEQGPSPTKPTRWQGRRRKLETGASSREAA
jgi:predicted DNA-binding transcriptional regulator AlpA